MRIGIVSDTHNNLKNVAKIVALFNEAGVSRVIHTGDITQAKTIAAFDGLEMPMWGVFGNNDQGELGSLQAALASRTFEFVQPPMPLFWAEKRIAVVHDPLEFELINPADYDVLLHGHTHRLTIERLDQRLVFNPGECAGMMPGANAVGVLDLASEDIQLLKF